METNKKKTNWLPIAAAAVLLVAVTAALLFSPGTDTDADKVDSPAIQSAESLAPQETESLPSQEGESLVIQEGESLVIPVSDVSTTAQFYPVEVDGTRMEVIAVLDSQGNIRTAFNTCQICYGSGRGYYVQEGDALVCQNCGNRFTVDHVEIISGGCNPWPIFPEDKTVTEESISISYDYLKEAVQIFTNWKTNS